MMTLTAGALTRSCHRGLRRSCGPNPRHGVGERRSGRVRRGPGAGCTGARPVRSTALAGLPIVVVSPMRRNGETGLQTHVHEMATALGELGRRVTVLTPDAAERVIALPVLGVRRVLHRLHAPTG